MRKSIMFVMLVIVALSSTILANAKEEKSQARVEKYFSTQEVFLTLLEPKISQFVKEEYGKDMKVHAPNIGKKGAQALTNAGLDITVEPIKYSKG